MKSIFSGARRYVRVAWRVPVTVELTANGKVLRGTTFNISAGGMCFHPPEKLPPGVRVVVEFVLPCAGQDQVFRLKATVVRELSLVGMSEMSALTFEDVSNQERHLLRECVLRRGLALVEAIADYQAFRNLSDLEVLELASVSHELVLSKGQHAAHYGDEASSVFLVRSGSVELRAPGSPDGAGQVETASAGQVFGEVSALLGLPHNLDVVACEDTELLVIPRSALAYLRDHNPQLALILYEIFTAFMGRRLRRLTGRLISPMSY